jgi:hypothetical protein
MRSVSVESARAAVDRASEASTAEESEKILKDALRELVGDAYFLHDEMPSAV